ncbi:hypothetical protein C8J56DRAFT_1017249 [Mycena floridula]|nr:hypothetical protein C8J56DRAFT_1017249 [Mycena floridula]
MVNTNKPGYFGKGSVAIDKGKPGESPIRRIAISADKLITEPFAGLETTCDIIQYAARTHGSKNALGWRDIVEVHEEEKQVKKMVEGKEVSETKKWKYFQLSDYKYLSFIELKDAISEVSRGLVELGVEKDQVFNIYSQTSLHWQLMSHGCAAISVTIATAYDTLGPEGLKHSLNEPECVGLFTNAELLPTLYNVLKDTPTVKLIVYDGEASSSLISDLHAVREDIRVISCTELRELGKTKSMDTVTARAPTKDTLACIMYTSGSTGAPKGVCITHSNLVASVGGAWLLLGHHLTREDSYLAYLPLAHVLEYIVEIIIIFSGMPTGFGRVKTLTDASVRKCKGDIAEFKPSIMVGVPAVWETIRKGIISKVNSGGTIKKNVFNGAMAAKKSGIPGVSQLADSVVLSGVRAATGGRLRIAMSGGAALSRETQEFLNVALVTMLQGYGMTETCGMCAILPPELMQYGPVGLPVPSTEIKLIDVPDAGYVSTNANPQGEVALRGPSVTKGYYKRDDLNNDKDIFTEDGFLRTGDVGQWNPDGTLSLIDRIKNLIKLAGGEYIALERLESVYKACNFVSNICVHASADATQPMAIIIPHESNLRHGLDSSLAGEDLETLCKNPKVVELVLKACNGVGKKNGFKPQEQLQNIVLTPTEWTPESGLVTAAQKIQRNKIAKHYKKEIDEVYKTK